MPDPEPQHKMCGSLKFKKKKFFTTFKKKKKKKKMALYFYNQEPKTECLQGGFSLGYVHWDIFSLIWV